MPSALKGAGRVSTLAPLEDQSAGAPSIAAPAVRSRPRVPPRAPAAVFDNAANVDREVGDDAGERRASGRRSYALETMMLAWSGEDVVKQGMNFDARGNLARPFPPRKPTIWIGGVADKSLDATARLAAATTDAIASLHETNPLRDGLSAVADDPERDE